MKQLREICIFLLLLLSPISLFACHLVTATEVNAVDNGDGTYTYTFDVCVGSENTYGFYLEFTGGNLVSFPASITGPTTGSTVTASSPVISGVGDLEYGDWDNNLAPLISDNTLDCFTLSLTFDNPITDATIGGTQIDFLPPTGCTPISIPTTSCFAPSYTVNIVTDNYGNETTWSVLDQATGATVASGGPYGNNLTISEDVCLPTGCYDFEVLDAFGDGMCCGFGNGSYSVVDNTSTVLASGASFAFSETSFISCNVILGIDLSIFEVYSGDENVNIINWTVASQESNDFFLIERSENLDDWIEVEVLKGAGSTTEKIEYEAIDQEFNNVINYYRLVQFDNDGSSTVFAPKSIDNRLYGTVLMDRTNYLGQQIDEFYQGLVIEYYSDGSITRTYQN